MKTLVLTSSEGFKAGYNLELIEDIIYKKAKSIYSKSDIEGNGINPQDVVMIIRFKDGNGIESTFLAKNWSMSFE